MRLKNQLNIKKILTAMKNPFVLLFVGAILGWVSPYILPSKPVEVSNIPKKELTCNLNHMQQIIKKPISNDDFQVLYKGEKVENPYLLRITITNTGEYSISNADFKTPLTIEFTNSEDVLNCNINKTTNSYILKEVVNNAKIEGNKIIITDFMLNPNESFSLNIITSSPPDTVKYDYRLEGISELSILNSAKHIVYAPKMLKDGIQKTYLFMFLGMMDLGMMALGMIVSAIFLWRLQHQTDIILKKYAQTVSKEKLDGIKQ